MQHVAMSTSKDLQDGSSNESEGYRLLAAVLAVALTKLILIQKATFAVMCVSDLICKSTSASRVDTQS